MNATTSVPTDSLLERTANRILPLFVTRTSPRFETQPILTIAKVIQIVAEAFQTVAKDILTVAKAIRNIAEAFQIIAEAFRIVAKEILNVAKAILSIAKTIRESKYLKLEPTRHPKPTLNPSLRFQNNRTLCKQKVATADHLAVWGDDLSLCGIGNNKKTRPHSSFISC